MANKLTASTTDTDREVTVTEEEERIATNRNSKKKTNYHLRGELSP